MPRPYFFYENEVKSNNLTSFTNGESLVKESKPGFTKEITGKSAQRPLNNLISN